MKEKTPIQLAKLELRKTLRKIRPKNQAEQSANISQSVRSHLLKFDQIKTIASFISLPGEVDLTSFHKSSPFELALPRVTGNMLFFHKINSLENDLEKGAFGIFEPKSHLPIVPIDRISTFLCPGLGFDKNGGRLGRGKGFYDRALQHASTKSRKIGICFPEQIMQEIPMESFDIRMAQLIYS